MKNKKSIIVASSLGFAIALLVIFGFLPLLSSLDALDKDLRDIELSLASQKQQNADLASLNRQYREIQENAERLTQAFVQKDTASILKFIEGIELISNSISLEETLTVTPLPQSTEDNITTSSIILTVTGSFSNIYRFLQSLEQQPYYITFKTIDITRSLDTDFTMTLNGNVHWQ